MHKSLCSWFIANSMEQQHTKSLKPVCGALPATRLGRSRRTRLALALAFLVGAATAVAQDAPAPIVPAEGFDAMSWLCVLNADDLPRSASIRQSAPVWASHQAPASFRSLGASAGFDIARSANASFASHTVDRRVSLGVGLCRDYLASAALVLASAPTGLDLGATSDTAPAGADILTSAGLSLSGYVDIPDTALRRAVEQTLGKRTDELISPLDMAGLTSLAARDMGIVDLSGLELAVRLKHLDLYGNAVSDVTPLAGLSSLEMLSLAHNRIRDDALPTLSRLSGLEVLSLAGNALDDLSLLNDFPRLRVLDLASTSVDEYDLVLLHALPQLEGLYLDDNDIRDVGSLGGLSRLKWLLLGGNAIENISPLSALVDLRALSLEGNAVWDLSPLVGLTALETLDLGDNAIDDISALAGLIKLQELDLWRNAIMDVSPLAQLADLRVLLLRENAIEDISVLAGLTALHTLHLPLNSVEDISALTGLIELQELHLWRNAITDVSPLTGLTGLRELSVGGNLIEDISPLAGLIELRELDLWRNAISDISPLAGLDELKILRLGENQIGDLSVLAGRTELMVLGLEDNAIADISVLAGLAGLEVLRLGGNVVQDISVLTGLTRLVELDLSRMGITDEHLPVLGGLAGLRELYLGGNSIEDLSPLADLRGLTWLDLAGNAITDLVPLTGLSRLSFLDLSSNAVEDILPLVLNDGLSTGDYVLLSGNPLSPLSRNELIPDLKSRGVEVEFDGGAQVSIPDDDLRSIVESALGKENGDPITRAEMAELTELSAASAGIEDLTGLEHAVKLVILELSDNLVKDLSPLAGLTELQVLDLARNAITDISPLAGLTELLWLSLSENAVPDISVLAGLTRLVELDLSRMGITDDDLPVLAELTALLEPVDEVLDRSILIDISDNAIVDISGLAGLAGPFSILMLLDNNAIEDVLPLVEETELGDGDFVSLVGNPLSGESTSVHIPALQARGVEVEFDGGAEVAFSAQRVITTNADNALWVHAADLDGDGDPDVLSASLRDDKVAWYENLGDGQFSSQRVITIDADGAASVHAADLDGDGDPDVLSASQYDDKVAWYENLGGGSFSSQRVITTDADEARSVHAADLDGDGDADVLSASALDDKVAWYENLGGGSFSSQRVITTDADRADSVHAADLDGDGDPDVLSASIRDDKIAWYENLGGGSFSTQRVITTDAEAARSVHAADLDGDGDADVLSASENDDKIAWYENLGGGSFSTQRVITTDAGGAASVYAADLDGDGDVDVLSASWLDAMVALAWYENVGGGSFSKQRVITTEARAVRLVHAADLDGDGDADVLSPSAGDMVAWYENLANHGDDHDNGIGAVATFATALPAFLHGTLESRGDRDVFRVATGSGTLRVSSNGPTDTFGALLNANGSVLALDDDSGTELNFRIGMEVAAGTHYVGVSGFDDSTTGPYTLSIEFVAGSEPQFEADGPEDQSYTTGTAIVALTLPAASGGSGALTYSLTPTVPGLSFDPVTRRLTGTPTATGDYVMTYTATDPGGASTSWTFTISVAAPARGVSFSAQQIITTDADGAISVYAADLDGDGDPDVLAASRIDDKIAWYENLGNGAFSPQRVITTNANNAESVHAADLDGDGDLDVLSASSDDDKIAWYENLGNGAFSAQRVITTNADGAYAVHAADLDSDGDADVLAASFLGETITWHENLGGGAFSAQRMISTLAPDNPYSVRGADLDGDGDADVLIGTEIGEIAWHENLGGGAFSAKRVITTDVYRALSVHAADLDGDGDPDLLSASSGDDKIAWYENQGGRTFSTQHVITSTSDGARSLHTVDFDGDGDVDVFAASSDGFTWYENQGGGAFSAQLIAVTGAASVHGTDLDGDGDPDLLVALYSDDTVAWYENLSDHGDDHGDSPAEATLVTVLPGFLHGTLESTGDRDVFRVATGRGTLRIRSNGPTDPFGSLLDTDGAELSQNDNSGAGTNFQIEAEVAPGVHYVEVRGIDSSTTGPYTLSMEFWRPVDVAQFLQDRPRIAAAMSWFGEDSQQKPYAEWPPTLKEKLDLAVRRQLTGEGSGLPAVMTNRASDVLDDDYSAGGTVLSAEDAEDLYVANVAHSLVLEMTGALPWSLDNLSERELSLLLSSRVEGSATGISGSGFYHRYGDVAGVTGYTVLGGVMPAPPEVAQAFMAQENLVGNSRYETIIRTIEWARYNLAHYSGSFSLKNVEDQWGYRGVPPLARMLSPTITTTRYGRTVGYTAGCHGTNWFFIHLLRAVNIPVENVIWAGHAVPSFPSEGLYLSHGDDPYTSFALYSPPFPEPFPTSEIPISEATYREWFSASNSSEENLRNVGRRVVELAVEYLPQALLVARCVDRANGVTNNASSYVYSPEYAGLGNFWTLAELEAMRFWERMDAKIEQYGGCSMFGF